MVTRAWKSSFPLGHFALSSPAELRLAWLKRDCSQSMSCLKQISLATQPIRSTNHIKVEARRQYGISTVVAQTPGFRREANFGVAESRLFSQAIERFHMTSRRPYWCFKTMKRRPCWCTKQILWELNFFLM